MSRDVIISKDENYIISWRQLENGDVEYTAHGINSRGDVVAAENIKGKTVLKVWVNGKYKGEMDIGVIQRLLEA